MSRNVEVQAAISERIRQQALEANEVLARLAAQARGQLPTSSHDTPNGEVQVFGMLSALVQIGRHQGLFNDKFTGGTTLQIEGFDAMLEKAYRKRAQLGSGQISSRGFSEKGSAAQ